MCGAEEWKQGLTRAKKLSFPSEPAPTAGFAAPNLSCAGEAVPKELQDSGDVNPEL